MTKDVLLAIRGLQFGEAEEESNIETITQAAYYKKNGSHFVIYEEAVEGVLEPTKNMIRFRDASLEITKKGSVNVHMIFEEKKKNLTNYATPFGDLLVGVDTKKIAITEEDSKIHIDVDYALDINYEFLADCKIHMDITERMEDDFTIFNNQ